MPDAYKSAVNRRNALIRWDRTADRTAATAAMRRGFLARLRAQVLQEHPGLADEAEITNRVERKLRIHYETMRANSLAARQRKAAERADQLAAAILDGEAP